MNLKKRKKVIEEEEAPARQPQRVPVEAPKPQREQESIPVPPEWIRAPVKQPAEVTYG